MGAKSWCWSAASVVVACGSGTADPAQPDSGSPERIPAMGAGDGAPSGSQAGGEGSGAEAPDGGSGIAGAETGGTGAAGGSGEADATAGAGAFRGDAGLDGAGGSGAAGTRADGGTPGGVDGGAIDGGSGAGDAGVDPPELCSGIEAPAATDIPERERCPACCAEVACSDSTQCQACDDAVRLIPERELLEEDIESFLWRITDEASHVTQKIMDPEFDLFRTLDLEDGLYGRVEGGGFQVVRTSPAESEADIGCARVLMRHFTGGHGGFGPTALDGTMDVLVTGDPASVIRVEVAGTLGTVEDGALAGVPSVSVELVWDVDVGEQRTELVTGRLGGITVPLP